MNVSFGSNLHQTTIQIMNRSSASRIWGLIAMDVEGANETDVKEEVAAPFLTLLGYQRGTENDILRELSISYGHNFLGRKKNNDPPLRGRADYVLSVTGAGRWVLEIKAPSEDITQDVIDQAISYARHPEVSGSYAAVLNGRRLVVLHNTQSSSDEPIVDIEVTSPDELAKQLSSLLSPAAIRRNCSPPVVDLGLPLSDGFRSSANIIGGSISYSNFWRECNYPLPENARAELDEMSRRLSDFRSTITGGRVWRDDSSRIIAKLTWALPHDMLMQFAREKNLMEVEYVSLNEAISSDPASPTVFDVVGSVSVSEGETLFDVVRWDTQLAGIEMSMNYRGQVMGYLTKGVLVGVFKRNTSQIFRRHL